MRLLGGVICIFIFSCRPIIKWEHIEFESGSSEAARNGGHIHPRSIDEDPVDSKGYSKYIVGEFRITAKQRSNNRFQDAVVMFNREGEARGGLVEVGGSNFCEISDLTSMSCGSVRVNGGTGVHASISLVEGEIKVVGNNRFSLIVDDSIAVKVKRVVIRRNDNGAWGGVKWEQ